MTVKKIMDGSKATLQLEGWLDTLAASELKDAIDALSNETEELVMDLAGLEYISSSGLRQFVAAHKKMNGNLTLKNASVEIIDILKMTGFDKKLHVI